MKFIKFYILLFLLIAYSGIASPTQQFMEVHSMTDINYVLQGYGMSTAEKELFKKMTQMEQKGFIGYHGGSSQARLFQDILFYTVRDLLGIPIRNDFVFLRTPDDADLKYTNAHDFLQQELPNLHARGGDNQPYLQKHILSLNQSLYQSYDRPWDLTPRYFLENATWTNPPFLSILTAFFKKLGIDAQYVRDLWAAGERLLPADRGFILQVFDRSESLAFTKQCSYAAFSGGKPHQQFADQHHLYDEHLRDFPQMRLVLGQKTTLNPISPLSFIRYDGMNLKKRESYEIQISNMVKQLPYDVDKVQLMKLKLLEQWNYGK